MGNQRLIIINKPAMETAQYLSWLTRIIHNCKILLSDETEAGSAGGQPDKGYPDAGGIE